MAENAETSIPHPATQENGQRGAELPCSSDAETGKREEWLKENRKAIDAYNEHVDANAVFSDNVRGFR